MVRFLFVFFYFESIWLLFSLSKDFMKYVVCSGGKGRYGDEVEGDEFCVIGEFGFLGDVVKLVNEGE